MWKGRKNKDGSENSYCQDGQMTCRNTECPNYGRVFVVPRITAEEVATIPA